LEHYIFYLAQGIPFVCVILAYLIGSIPTSYLIGKIFFKADIRQSGSGNPGATNTLRTFGVKAGIIVLLIDVLKGVAVVVMANYLLSIAPSVLGYILFTSLSYLAVVLGHMFSIYMRFKGGKGVATTAGVFLAISPLPFLYCVVLFVFIVAVTKYVSLGSILGASAFLLVELLSQVLLKFPNVPRLVVVIIIVVLILFKHKANFKRLCEGNENKFSFRKSIQE
jgi:glycerol-3-phosphate acyltransferase PlsY